MEILRLSLCWWAKPGSTELKIQTWTLNLWTEDKPLDICDMDIHPFMEQEENNQNIYTEIWSGCEKKQKGFKIHFPCLRKKFN